MRKTLILTLTAGVAILAVAGAKPALSMPTAPAIQSEEANVGVLDVGYRDRYSRRRHYAYGYRPYYRPYHRPYGYYRPYAYYGGYPYYYRRPGIGLGFWF
jgi:hypothetical protein